MSFINSSPYVQLDYPDFHGAGYPGQYFQMTDAWNNVIKSYPVGSGTNDDAFIFCGRMIMQDIAQSDATAGLEGTLPTNAPFSVRALTATDTTASEYLGVVLRSFVGNVNNADEDGQRKAGFPEKTIAPIVPLGKGVILLVRQAAGLSVTYGDTVYVATDTIVGPPNYFPGEFAKAAGTNLVLVPNAIWYTTKTATDIDQIGAIEFK